jgi:hypothetical protein
MNMKVILKWEISRFNWKLQDKICKYPSVAYLVHSRLTQFNYDQNSMKLEKLFGNEQLENALGACPALILDSVSMAHNK